jgi:hypothetical protein
MQIDSSPLPKPFWHRLNTFFAFPFQMEPLIYALALAFSSLIFLVLFFLPNVLVILLTELAIVLAASRYGFKVIAFGSRGISRASDFPRHLEDEWSSMPWKLFGVSVVQVLVAGVLTSLNPRLGTLALLVISFTFPASVIVLVQFGRVSSALSPGLIWETITIIGWPYALLCFFLFLLSAGSQIAVTMLMPIFKGLILLPIINFAMIYFGWVMASLLGYVMYQNHRAFGVDLLPGGGEEEDKPVDRRTPAQIAEQETDAQVARLVTEGDVAGALAMAYQALRDDAQSLSAQRRYHRVLLLAPDRVATLLEQAKPFIALLMARHQTSEALKVYKACRERDTKFALDDAPTVLTLAQAEWRGGDARTVLALLSGFDKRFRGHAAIPLAYELAARVLVQGMHRADMARPILGLLEARYPDSEQLKEVRWLLRDTAPAAAAPLASA